MKEKWEEHLFAAIFIVGLFSLSFLSLDKTIPAIKETILNMRESIEKREENGDDRKTSEIVVQTLSAIDSNINSNVYKRYSFVELYGKINRIIGKKEVNGFEYALDKNGAYNSVNFWVNVNDANIQRYAQQMLMLKEAVNENGAEFLFLGFPNKYNDAWDSGYDGMPYNDYNNKMDELLLWCRRYKLDYIDYRETMKNSGLSFKEMFYKTDHHWTGYAAFLAFTELVDHLNEKYDAGLDEDYYYRNIDNYELEWKPNTLLGGFGRNVGKEFGDIEIEDFQTIKPKFSNNIIWSGNAYTKKGDYLDTVINEDKLEVKDSIYETDGYAYYLGGVYERDSVINEDNPDGLKILFIRDSFASPIIIDLIPMCSKIDCVWGKYATDKYVKNQINKEDYDYVIVAYYTEDILANFFHFYENDYPETETVVEE